MTKSTKKTKDVQHEKEQNSPDSDARADSDGQFEVESKKSVPESGDSPEGPDSPDDQEPSEDAHEMMTPGQMLGELATSRAEVEKLKDGYLRAKAEAENIQRRSKNEIASIRKYAVEGFARELLSVADSLDQAAKVRIDDSGAETVSRMKEGLELTLRQLETVFDKFGISPVEADAGVHFNPDVHQAISMVDSEEVESGAIVSVMQKGFTLKDRLLRPAMVVIAN